MLSDEVASWPIEPDAVAIGLRCGRCKRTLQHKNQNRCPWLSCRAYLRGRFNLWNYDKQKKEDHA